MNFTESLDVLKKENSPALLQDQAREVIKTEIARCESLDLEVTFARLVTEMQQSSNASFSYQILRAIFESDDSKIEPDDMLRTFFVEEALESKTVRNGVWKCMRALAACTKTSR